MTVAAVVSVSLALPAAAQDASNVPGTITGHLSLAVTNYDAFQVSVSASDPFSGYYRPIKLVDGTKTNFVQCSPRGKRRWVEEGQVRRDDGGQCQNNGTGTLSISLIEFTQETRGMKINLPNGRTQRLETFIFNDEGITGFVAMSDVEGNPNFRMASLLDANRMQINFEEDGSYSLVYFGQLDPVIGPTQFIEEQIEQGFEGISRPIPENLTFAPRPPITINPALTLTVGVGG